MATTTTTNLNRLRNLINLAVSHIGSTNGTRRPTTTTSDNKQGVAYELAVAQLVSKRAAARYRKAIKDAIDAGVMFDHTKSPLAADIIKTLYADDVVTVIVKTTTAHTRLNSSKLRDLLVARGMKFEDVDALFKQASDKTNPPHEFIADIVSADVAGVDATEGSK